MPTIRGFFVVRNVLSRIALPMNNVELDNFFGFAKCEIISPNNNLNQYYLIKILKMVEQFIL